MSMLLRFESKVKRECHGFYLKCDVLLSADIFENFKKSRLRNFELCLSHYLKAPALCWDAMRSMTEVELEIASHADMGLFFEQGMRGRVS